MRRVKIKRESLFVIFYLGSYVCDCDMHKINSDILMNYFIGVEYIVCPKCKSTFHSLIPYKHMYVGYNKGELL